MGERLWLLTPYWVLVGCKNNRSKLDAPDTSRYSTEASGVSCLLEILVGLSFQLLEPEAGFLRYLEKDGCPCTEMTPLITSAGAVADELWHMSNSTSWEDLNNFLCTVQSHLNARVIKSI